MKIKLLSTLLLVFGLSLSVFSQVAEKENSKASYNEDNSKAPSSTTRIKSGLSKKKSKKKQPAGHDRLVVEQKERMVANTKKNLKLAKEMEKPQYSDPMYFGHKKKPKKRPLGKRKFCKECQMVH